ncbi:MAG: leucine-rich repeat domain-containing protein [Bacteroidetes bacterium]|nr:leucine-rich repeat domain-containing protein [Bacteroidota bacterium]
MSLNEINIIPDAIENLTALQSLLIDGNFFLTPDKKIKILPESLCALTSLTTLSLKDHAIEQLPSCIGSLTVLQHLYLRDNLLSTLPSSFAQLKNLKTLDLKANELIELPLGFEKLSSLAELNLSMNPKLKFDVAKTIFLSMKHLSLLDLSYNNISLEQITPLRIALPDCKVLNWSYKKK